MGCGRSATTPPADPDQVEARQVALSGVTDESAVTLLKYGTSLKSVFHIVELRSPSDRYQCFQFRQAALKTEMLLDRLPDSFDHTSHYLAIYKESDGDSQRHEGPILACARVHAGLEAARQAYSFTLPSKVDAEDIVYIDEVVLDGEFQREKSARMVYDLVKQAATKLDSVSSASHILFAYNPKAVHKPILPVDLRKLEFTGVSEDDLHKSLTTLAIAPSNGVQTTSASKTRPSVQLPINRVMTATGMESVTSSFFIGSMSAPVNQYEKAGSSEKT